ncbi:hypothetical protein AMTRI_Chr03g51270 [Amborella trichopoda]
MSWWTSLVLIFTPFCQECVVDAPLSNVYHTPLNYGIHFPTLNGSQERERYTVV